MARMRPGCGGDEPDRLGSLKKEKGVSMITQEQVKKIEALRTNVLSMVADLNTDEYLLATLNGVLRRLDDRLPKIKQRAEGKTLKAESRKLVQEQREAGKKKGASSHASQTSHAKAS
jgi:hypothetical protein